MKLLFDHNLSHKLVQRLSDLFPGSTHTRLIGMSISPDWDIWTHARINSLIIVTLDKDYADLSMLHGAPPKVIWLRCGNSTVDEVERLLRLQKDEIIRLHSSPEIQLLEIWP